MSRVREVIVDWGLFTFGVAVYPYQIALGVSLRYWPCIFAPSIRVHIGPFKLHASIIFRRMTHRKKGPLPGGKRLQTPEGSE